MLTLYILRHAKSSWALPGVNDHERTLNDRGLKDLPKIGAMMAEKNYLPESILCSSAKRTQTTLEGILSCFSARPPVSISNELYASGVDYYLRTIKNAPDCQSLMIVGHNPMCDEITRLLVKSGESEAMQNLAEHYPTGALSVLEFDFENWADVANNTGYLRDFQKPREL